MEYEVESNIYLIPQFIPCEKCGYKISTLHMVLNEYCPLCKAVQHQKNYGKYLGMIKDVKDER